jgi:hypothetical protein
MLGDALGLAIRADSESSPGTHRLASERTLTLALPHQSEDTKQVDGLEGVESSHLNSQSISGFLRSGDSLIDG